MAESNPISRYQQATQAYTDAEARASRLATKATEIGRSLANWKEVMFANTGGGIGFPAELALSSRAPSVNVQDWPTAKRWLRPQRHITLLSTTSAMRGRGFRKDSG